MDRRVHRIIDGIVCLAFVSALAGCSGERSYEVQGRIAGFGDGHTLIVEHGDIPGLMPAMTMPFEARVSTSLDSLHTGDAVAFVLYIRGDSTWIDNIRRLPDDAVPEHPAGKRQEHASSAPELFEMGDPVPNTTLQSHADTTFNLTQFKGTPVVLTFIYTRCPLPDYCPLVTQNFVRLQERIENERLGPVHLVSISFDPEYDSPAILREYAGGFDADLSSWTFATGDSSDVASVAHRFGVYYRTQGGEIVHNLSTALIDAEGRIRRIWRGNDWTVDQILTAIRGAAPA